MISKGVIYIIVGLIVLLIVIGSISFLQKWLGNWSLWIMCLGFPAGGFLILRGREKLGLKNKYFGKD